MIFPREECLVFQQPVRETHCDHSREPLWFHRLFLMPNFEVNREPGEKLFRLRRCDAGKLPVGCQNFAADTKNRMEVF
jgi:hypothetical protein